MTTRPRFRLLRRMTRELWHEQRKAGFLRWTLWRAALLGVLVPLVSASFKHLRAHGFPTSADGLALLFNAFLEGVPMFFLIAFAVYALVWLDHEEEFFHKPASGDEGG